MKSKFCFEICEIEIVPLPDFRPFTIPIDSISVFQYATIIKHQVRRIPGDYYLLGNVGREAGDLIEFRESPAHSGRVGNPTGSFWKQRQSN